MSTQLIDHNEDLSKLKNDGYDVSIVNNNIVVKGIPYVNMGKQILFGTIYCPLTLSGTKTVPPQDHTIRFIGEHPCNQFGEKNTSFVNSQQTHRLTPDLIGSFYFSSKPPTGRYPDFYTKINRYASLLSAPAKSIDPSVTALNFDYKSYHEDSVYEYPDTNTARAGVTNISNKLKGQKVAIVGLGGTGSFVLDYVSKTPIQQISLFDGDVMYTHNAFRIPGVMSESELNQKPSKVSFLQSRYEKVRTGIVAHEVFLNESNVDLLTGHDFVFLALDLAEPKKTIIDFLLKENIPFVDLGMGLTVSDNAIRGVLRKTLVTPDNNSALEKIAMGQAADDDVYAENIQISELNAINAALGVLTWKKLYGFYTSAEDIFNSNFILDEEVISNAT